MKIFLTFCLLTALLFTGCPETESQRDFLTEDEVMPLIKPAPVIDYPAQIGEEEFAKLDFLTYEMFGATNNGEEDDDFDAIVKTHDVANMWNKKVKIEKIKGEDPTYVIGGADITATIQTSTDWGNATIIIDDRNAVNLNRTVFRLTSKLPYQRISSIKELKRGQKKLDLHLEHPCFILVEDSTKYVYRREGMNGNGGVPLSDMLVVDREGNVREDTPIIFDIDNITLMRAFPIDEETLYISGGNFKNHASRKRIYTYANRAIQISRSNVVVSGIDQQVISRSTLNDWPALYRGFLIAEQVTDVLLKDIKISGRYGTGLVGSSYGCQINYVSNVYFKNCTQYETRGWGIFGSSNTKNLTFDNVQWTRFDSHRGVFNVDILDSNLIQGGSQGGARSLGEGTIRIMNTRIQAQNVISMREDYGSSWQGDIILQNVKLEGSGPLIGISQYLPFFNYGLPLYFAKRIWVDGFTRVDGNDNPVNASTDLISGYVSFWPIVDSIKDGTATYKDWPGAFREWPELVYLKDVNTPINVGGTNLLTQRARQIRSGDQDYVPPPKYATPAVKFLPYSEKDGKPVYAYRGDYTKWESFPDPDKEYFTRWGRD